MDLKFRLHSAEIQLASAPLSLVSHQPFLSPVSTILSSRVSSSPPHNTSPYEEGPGGDASPWYSTSPFRSPPLTLSLSLRKRRDPFPLLAASWCPTSHISPPCLLHELLAFPRPSRPQLRRGGFAVGRDEERPVDCARGVADAVEVWC